MTEYSAIGLGCEAPDWFRDRGVGLPTGVVGKFKLGRDVLDVGTSAAGGAVGIVIDPP